jgi:hypothetical protein
MVRFADSHKLSQRTMTEQEGFYADPWREITPSESHSMSSLAFRNAKIAIGGSDSSPAKMYGYDA